MHIHDAVPLFPLTELVHVMRSVPAAATAAAAAIIAVAGTNLPLHSGLLVSIVLDVTAGTALEQRIPWPPVSPPSSRLHRLRRSPARHHVRPPCSPAQPPRPSSPRVRSAAWAVGAGMSVLWLAELGIASWPDGLS